MHYSVELMDKNMFTQEQCRVIEQRYSDALRETLGDSREVVLSHRAWVKAKTRQDELPATDISLEEKRAIQHWEHAEVVARLLAFEGYAGTLEELYIEVKTQAEAAA